MADEVKAGGAAGAGGEGAGSGVTPAENGKGGGAGDVPATVLSGVDGDAGPKGGEEERADAGEAGDGDESGAPPETSWPEKGLPDNWLDRMLDGVELDDKARETLKRRKTPGDLVKSVLEGTKKITELSKAMEGMVKVPDFDKATPQELADFYGKLGVPKDPADYKWDVPEAFKEQSEFDKGLEGNFVKGLHVLGLTPTQVAGIMKLRFSAADDVSKAVNAGLEAAHKQTNAAVAKAFGKDTKEVLDQAKALGTMFWGKDKEAVLDLKLADGSRLGDNEAFVIGFANMAKAWKAEGGELVQGEPGDVGKSDQARFDEIMGYHAKAMAGDDAAKAKYKAAQPELLKLTQKLNGGKKGPAAQEQPGA